MAIKHVAMCYEEEANAWPDKSSEDFDENFLSCKARKALPFLRKFEKSNSDSSWRVKIKVILFQLFSSIRVDSRRYQSATSSARIRFRFVLVDVNELS